MHKLLFNDITNQSFGKLTALSYETRADGIYWLCQCECGNQVAVETGNLRNGNTQSCGCLQKERTSENNFQSLVGKRFGKLLVIDRVENNLHGNVCYKCKCDCGGETIIASNNLR